MPKRSSTEVLAVILSASALVTLVLTLVVVLVTLSNLRSEAQQAVETHIAVCSYKNQLVDQIKSSEKYLREHPKGAPSLGISAAQIQQGINKQLNAVASLSGLSCPAK